MPEFRLLYATVYEVTTYCFNFWKARVSGEIWLRDVVQMAYKLGKGDGNNEGETHFRGT